MLPDSGIDGFPGAHFVALRRVGLCSLDFGIGEFLAAALVSAGIGAETAAIAGPALLAGVEGAGIGAAGSAITGGDPLTGAITGGLTAGVTSGLGGPIGGALGIGDFGGGILAGSGAGALGAGITGGDPLTGALTGGAGAAIMGLGNEVFSGSGVSDFFGGGGGQTTSAFGGAPSDASNAITYNPSVAPGVSGGAGFEASPLTVGAPTTIGGPGVSGFSPPPAGAGSIDLTASFGSSPGGDVVSGASTADALPSGSPVSTPSSGSYGQLTPDIIQNAGGVVGVDPGNLPTPPIPPAGGAPTSGGFFSGVGDAISDAGKFISGPTGKLIGTGISGLGLANSLLSAGNPNPIPGMADVQKLATQLGSTGAGLIGPNAAAATGVADSAHQQAGVLQNYLNTGTLPPAAQTALDTATNNAITAIKAQYASRGMPPGSSSEVQDINAIRQNAVIQGGTLAASLYGQGVSQDQLAAQIYQNLVGQGAGLTNSGIAAQAGLVTNRTALNNGLNASIANLATSLGGGRINNTNTVQAQAA